MVLMIFCRFHPDININDKTSSIKTEALMEFPIGTNLQSPKQHCHGTVYNVKYGQKEYEDVQLM